MVSFARYICFLALVGLSAAQSQTPDAAAAPARARGNTTPQRAGFEVHPDRTVTFRLRAPDAATVRVTGDFRTTSVFLHQGGIAELLLLHSKHLDHMP